MMGTPRPATEKVSVSIDRAELRWAKSLSKQLGISVSSVLSDALRVYHEEKARQQATQELLARFGPGDRASPAEARAMLARWRG
jgi:hypothetical protein